jgi:flagellin-like hook-associated protein FlgL
VKQLQEQLNSVTNTEQYYTGVNVLKRSGVSQTISSEPTRTSPPTFTDSIANISGSEDLLNTCNNNANIQHVVVDPCNIPASPYMNTFKESKSKLSKHFNRHCLWLVVSDEMKAKIWANEFINFGQLLPEEENRDKPTTITVERNMFNKPQLAFQEHSKKIKTLDHWITAFSIYMTIYCQKYQDTLGDLVKYMERLEKLQGVMVSG